jgi:transposase
MSKEPVSDELWDLVEPPLPEAPPEPGGSRPRVPDRAALAGIVSVSKSGIPWKMPPRGRAAGPGASRTSARCAWDL